MANPKFTVGTAPTNRIIVDGNTLGRVEHEIYQDRSLAQVLLERLTDPAHADADDSASLAQILVDRLQVRVDTLAQIELAAELVPNAEQEVAAGARGN